MSVDPLAAAVAGSAGVEALVDAELAKLAADGQALRATLVENAVVTARVLPSNGLTDLVEIAGRRVAASLPPTVRPGDVVQLAVTGFDGDRILLQLLDGLEPAVAPETPPPAIPPSGTTVALSPSVVTRATVLPAGAPAQPAVPSAPAAATGAAPASPAGGLNWPLAPQIVAPPRVPVVVPIDEPTSIEARVAAARAASPPGAAAPLDDSPTAALARAPEPRFVAPPQITPKAGSAGGQRPAQAAGAVAEARSAGVRVPGAPTRGLGAYAEPAALLRALKLPATPANLSSATLALERPERLPDVLAALERALPRDLENPHVTTLRVLLEFVGKIDPRSPALGAQIEAYVDHVVDGNESKLAALFGSLRPADPADGPGATADAAQSTAALAGGASLAGDLKQTLFALAADPSVPESLAPQIASALTAVTAMQVSAAQTLAAYPDGLAFAIPLTTQFGPANAHITVKRDAPHGNDTRMDPANFRIAFVLDTMHLGTVAIDLVTVGRDVTVEVRTEAAAAMRAFRDALGTLTARLESLNYRVAATGAAVGTTSTVAIEAPPPRPADGSVSVDRSA